MEWELCARAYEVCEVFGDHIEGFGGYLIDHSCVGGRSGGIHCGGDRYIGCPGP